ncbi:hypothetical protein SAY86_024484 [Trapa natans]|uniref:Uncharacterized protein n=1 Tax=Trapa natans TaxID=22666 RepID=A0AAN7M5A5_TRANT|nr:hypothetical protein SAY86_024484 [Trapa natans]
MESIEPKKAMAPDKLADLRSIGPKRSKCSSMIFRFFYVSLGTFFLLLSLSYFLDRLIFFGFAQRAFGLVKVFVFAGNQAMITYELDVRTSIESARKGFYVLQH